MDALPKLDASGEPNGGRGAPPAGRKGPEVLDPLRHPGWDALLAGHAGSSFFHTAAWAQVLQRSYGHVPAYFCQFDQGRLAGLLPVMEVSSPLTGRRGVSLPFSDFCPRLQAPERNPAELYDLAMERGRQSRWRYLECRSSDAGWRDARPSLAFHGHVVDLSCGPEALFKALDSAVRRGIRKAGEARLEIEISHDRAAVESFYALHCQTRRRQGVPPQPARFFGNIAACVVEPRHGFVATARLQGKPVASAVFFQHGRQALYKFGASDYAFQQLRPNHLLMWETMKRLAEQGFALLHLGRTSLGHEGLRRFKLSFGAREEQITYCRYDFRKGKFVTNVDRTEGWVNRVFRCLPPSLLRLVGTILYPHLS